MQTPLLRVHPSEMPLAWYRVYQDLKERGFLIAANNMREIMRATNPRAYFAHVAISNPRVGVAA